MSEQSVAIVVPTYKQSLSAAEELSIRSLRNHLSNYQIILAVPEGLRVSLRGSSTAVFPAEYFAGRHKYSELLVSSRFYRAFERYDYILVYQLDCLVFGDHLQRWCGLGYDYVGAPWLRRLNDCRVEFAGVGNGGFSLRRVQSCLEVLAERDRQRRWSDWLGGATNYAAAIARSAGRGVSALLGGDTHGLVERSCQALRHATYAAVPEYRNEDWFWAGASMLVPEFRIPGPEIAVSFAFETEPRFCYESNGHRLPFGCHQWQRYDPAFWEPHLSLAIGSAT